MAITNDILDELIGNAKSQDDLFGKDGVIKDLSKQLMESCYAEPLNNRVQRLRL